jgi:hypothetical protein
MALAEELGLKPEKVAQRIAFLEQRAKAHLQSEGGRRDFEQACAAALLRDAGALALLLGDIPKARTLLLTAGSGFAGLGLFAGYALMSLAGPGWWFKERRDELSGVLDLFNDATKSAIPKEAQEDDHLGFLDRERPRQPFMTASLGSTRQLVFLYQALAAHRDEDDMAGAFAGVLERRLLETPTTPIGPTGLPLLSYFKAMEASRHGDFASATRDALASVAGLRAEQLQAAQEDRYHWRLAMAPTDLIDFDLMALGAISIDARGTVDGLDEPFRRRERGVDAPFRAAADLRSDAH